jgi:hypothetical protein
LTAAAVARNVVSRSCLCGLRSTLTPCDSSPPRFEEIEPVSIDEFSVLEPMTGLRPAADTVTGPPEDWRAAVTGYRPPAGPDGYWPPPRLGDRDEPELGGTDPISRKG